MYKYNIFNNLKTLNLNKSFVKRKISIAFLVNCPIYNLDTSYYYKTACTTSIGLSGYYCLFCTIMITNYIY